MEPARARKVARSRVDGASRGAKSRSRMGGWSQPGCEKSIEEGRWSQPGSEKSFEEGRWS